MNGARMMMIKRLSLFGLLFALGMSSAGASALDPCEESEKVDAELNRVYKQILRKYKDQPLFLKKLKLAQRAWIKFRDAHIVSIFPEDDRGYHYGTAAIDCSCWQLTYRTRLRVKELKVWLKGTEEGDLCKGSVKYEHELR